jgi:hypothetical protein
VSWQEELRVLDEELATGRISADEYRVRRDKVMSSAIAQPQAPPQQDPGGQSEKTQYVTPVQPQSAPAQPQSPVGERTQVVSGGDSDRTQAVAGGGWQATRPGADSDRTQVVSMGGPPPPYAMPGHQQQHQAPPPWGHQQHQDDMAPPWAGSEFPPLAPSGNPDWIKQGPEVFENQSGKGKVIAIVAVVVLLLGGLGVGAYFWFFKEGSSTAGGPTTTAPPATTTTPPPPPDPLPLGALPGKVTVNGAVSTFADMPDQKYLSADELKAYNTGKPADTKLVICDLGSGNRLVVMLVQMPSGDAAQKAAKALHKLQTDKGMKADSSAPDGVQVATRAGTDGNPGRFRAHFASGDVVVRLDLSTKESNGSVTFNDSLAGQLEKTPADG